MPARDTRFAAKTWEGSSGASEAGGASGGWSPRGKSAESAVKREFEHVQSSPALYEGARAPRTPESATYNSQFMQTRASGRGKKEGAQSCAPPPFNITPRGHSL